MKPTSGLRQFIVAGTVTSFLTLVGVKLLGLFESVAVGRILGPDRFGLLTLVLSIMTLVASVSACGLPAAVTKFVAGEAGRSREAANRTLRAAIKLSSITTTLTALGFAMVAVFVLAPYYGPRTLPLLLLIVPLTIFGPVFALFTSALQGLGKVRAMNIRYLAAAAIGLVTALALAPTLGTEGALVAFAIASIIPGALSLRAVEKSIDRLPSNPQTMGMKGRALLEYSLPMLLSGLVVLPTFYLVSSTLATSGGFDQLGAFSIAYALSNVITFIPSAVGVPLFPALSSLSTTSPQRGRALVAEMTRATTFVSTPLVVIAILFGQEIITWTYGSEFLGGTAALAILSASALLVAAGSAIGGQLAGTGKTWIGFAVNGIWSAIVVLTTLLLIPPFGIAGAALSIFFGYCALATALIVVARSILDLDLREMKAPATWAAASVAVAFIALAWAGPLRIAASLVVLGACFVGESLLLSPKERSLISTFIPRQLRPRCG